MVEIGDRTSSSSDNDFLWRIQPPSAAFATGSLIAADPYARIALQHFRRSTYLGVMPEKLSREGLLSDADAVPENKVLILSPTVSVIRVHVWSNFVHEDLLKCGDVVSIQSKERNVHFSASSAGHQYVVQVFYPRADFAICALSFFRSFLSLCLSVSFLSLWLH